MSEKKPNVVKAAIDAAHAERERIQGQTSTVVDDVTEMGRLHQRFKGCLMSRSDDPDRWMESWNRQTLLALKRAGRWR